MRLAALKYARAGWSVFPVQRREDGHFPLVQDWPRLATHSVSIVDEWWTKWPKASIGAIPASVGLLAVDYDVKHGKTIGELREALANALGGYLPDTGRVATTPSGGEHHYYKVSEAVACSNGKIVQNVDIRSANNGYIMLPPSMGGRYKWAHLGEAPPLPEQAYKLFGAPGERIEHEWTIEADTPENVELATSYLRGPECRSSTEGSGGNQALYDTACMMVSYGISSGRAVELLSTIYNEEKCYPPWDVPDIERTVSNAYRYHTSAPGNLTPAYRQSLAGFQPLKVSESDIGGLHTTDYFRITDRDSIIALPPPEWLVSPYLQAETCAILTGGYSTYKSFIALDMALSIVSRPQQSAWDTRLRGPVVYMLGEGRSGMGKRLAAWERHHGLVLDKNDILFVDPVPHISMGRDIRDSLVKALLNIGDGYKFVVVDTMGRAMSGLNENASETASALSKMASELREGLGACVLAVGHTRKDRTTGQGATRGSGVFENDADTVLNSETVGDLRVTLEVVKQKDAPEAEAVSLILKEVGESLVIQREIAPPPAPRREQKDEGYHVVDAVAVAVLSSNPHQYWSTRNLAIHVASDERVRYGQEAVRKRLVDMSVRSAFKVSQMFLPPHGQGRARWKYTPLRE